MCEFRSNLDTHSTANWTAIPRQTGQSNRDVAVRGITVATSAIFTGEPHGQQQVIHEQDYRNTPPALRMRSQYILTQHDLMFDDPLEIALPVLSPYRTSSSGKPLPFPTERTDHQIIQNLGRWLVRIFLANRTESIQTVSDSPRPFYR